MTLVHRIMRNWWHRRDGVAALEFALLLPALLFMVFGVIEFGRLYWVQSSLQHATEETGRQAMAAGGSVEAIRDVLSSSVAGAGINPSRVTMTVSTESAGMMNFARINASYEFYFVFGLWPEGGIPLTGTSRVPLPPT